MKQACEKTIKDEELAPTLQIHAQGLSFVAQPLLDRVFERDRCGIISTHHDSSVMNECRYCEADSTMADVNSPRRIPSSIA